MGTQAANENANSAWTKLTDQTGTGTGAEPRSRPKPTRVQSNQSNLEIIHKTPANHRDRHREPETETETGAL